MAGRVFGDLGFQGGDADPCVKRGTCVTLPDIGPAILVPCHQGAMVC